MSDVSWWFNKWKVMNLLIKNMQVNLIRENVCRESLDFVSAYIIRLMIRAMGNIGLVNNFFETMWMLVLLMALGFLKVFYLFPANHGIEPAVGISCIVHYPLVTIGIHHGVCSLHRVSVPWLLVGLLISRVVILNSIRELVMRMGVVIFRFVVTMSKFRISW